MLLSERDFVRPILVLESNISKYVIILISIALIVICWSFFIYNATKGVKSAVNFGICQAGQCATNLVTGEKRCDIDINNELLYNQATEVCNSQYYCDNALTPYALQSDGSTNVNGVCEKDVACRCVDTQSCPIYSTTLFQMKNGSAYTGTSYNITQTPVIDGGNYGTVSSKLSNNNTQFCKINASTLNSLTPNTCDFTGVPTLKEVYGCISNNFCTVGVPAYIVSGKSISDFNSDLDYNYYPLTCVLGSQCPANMLPVWNLQTGSITCVSCQNCST